MMDNLRREYDRGMLRSAYQSLFWTVMLARKREGKFTLKALADKLGIDKSYVSRSFATPPNWQINKLSDMSDALDIDLFVAGRDRKTGAVYTSTGILQASVSTTNPAQSNELDFMSATDGQKLKSVPA